MKKEYRIKKNQDFQAIISKKHHVANSKFVIYYRKNSDHLKVGISASKKLGNAVLRNKIKRQVRMMVQQVFDKRIKMDLIIIVRKSYLFSSFEKNKEDLRNLYNQIKRR